MSQGDGFLKNKRNCKQEGFKIPKTLKMGCDVTALSQLIGGAAASELESTVLVLACGLQGGVQMNLW